ncbi:ABC transporter permease [Cytobacillus depressus]|uniref:ABC transporter permease n=1 Tax=Cytobacillus depressus TaxID=1602942 RepID=A0A6L3VCQ9_9BACI|nr:ABC transporter permease [Cytobacillus depressus]KAB2337121.1 ABC transporter permease [Cytobacillus depressus]
MSNFWIILGHTYFSKLKTKSFIITTLLSLVIVAGLTNMSKIMDFFNDGKDAKEKIAVLDETGELFHPLMEQLKVNHSVIQIEVFTGTEQEAEDAVKMGEYNGLLKLSYNEEHSFEAIYKARSIADTTLSSEFQHYLQQIKTELTASKINLTQEQLSKLYEPVAFSKMALEENAKTEEELNEARGLVYVLLFIIYFSVLMYANMIAMEVATEKSSRVMEILISSVAPVKQMFAKIIGIALLSLTQMGVLFIVGYYFVKSNLETMEGGFFEFFGFSHIPISTIIYALAFLLLGYFLYATLAAFLGSLVSRIEDVQQMIMPMTMMVVAGFMIALFGLSQPDTTFITIASYIPFFTPMLMFMRVGMLSLPVWEPLLGMAILIISIVILAIFGAKVYKGGVLMYGRSNSFKDIKKALQLTKNE